MRLLKLAVISLLAVLTAPAQARDAVPIVNYTDVVITTGSGKVPTAEQVKQALIAAGARRNWSYNESGPNQLTASTTWNGKHTISASISYSPERYSIQYRDSINMKFGMQDGVPVIHPHYNKFVQELMTHFRIEISKI